MQLGTGSHVYEWIENWLRLPKHIELGYTHGVVIDRNDNVYIHHQNKDSVLVFDPDGNYIKSWGDEFADGAHGMFLSRENGSEYLYLADYKRHLVCKTTLDGEVLFRLGVPDRKDIYASDEEYQPTDVAVAPNGDFYVFDGYGKPFVHQYDRNANYLQSFGGEGADPGRLKCPHGGWVDTRNGNPVLLVADRNNNRIQKFTLDGKHLGFINEHMQKPCCFYEHQGDLYIPDLLARVTILDSKDRLITHLGENPQAPKTNGWPNIQDTLQAGKFNSPHAVAVDSRGDLYVAEWISTGRVTKLKRVKT